MSFRFVPNPNFPAEFTQTPECRALLHQAADAVEGNAKEIVNVDSGDYNDSFERLDTPDGVVLGNTDIAAHIIEWGSVNDAPQGPLRGGSRAAGLRLEETEQ